jgi:hypothetical protein
MHISESTSEVAHTWDSVQSKRQRVPPRGWRCKVEDLRSLKFRMTGFAGKIIAKLGVVPRRGDEGLYNADWRDSGCLWQMSRRGLRRSAPKRSQGRDSLSIVAPFQTNYR